MPAVLQWLYDAQPRAPAALRRHLRAARLVVTAFVCGGYFNVSLSAPRHLCAPSLVRPVACAPRRLCAPSLVRPNQLLLLFSLMASLALSFLAAPSAHAGTYVWQATDPSGNPTQSPTFTGGLITYANGSPSRPYATSSTGFDVPGPPFNVTKASGTVQVAYTWQASGSGDLPPQAVIVTETRSASWSYFNTAPPSAASCSDGLSGASNAEVDHVVANPPSSPPGAGYSTYSGSSSGTWYSVQTPDSSGKVGFSVSGLQSNVTFAPIDPTQNWAYAVLDDQITVSPVTITLSGTTKDSSGNFNILVGQGCTASLSGIPSNCTVSNYKWSVSDSNAAFQSWNVTYVAGKSSTAALVSGPGPLTNSTAHWYWSDKAGSQTVSCTATVTPPAGQGKPFQVTATQPVSLVIPTIRVTPTTGRVQINDLAQSVYGPGYYLYDGPGNGSQYGITWTATVATPSLFTQNSTQNGTLWNFVQITKPSRYRAVTGGSQQPSALNGQYGLDTTYPYEPGPYSAAFPGGYSASTMPSSSSDSPAVFISDTYQNYQVLDSFQTYIMYSPPGTDTQWVPVWVIEWYWTANDTIPGTSWADWNNVTDAGIVRATNTESATVHPTWSNLVLAPPAGVF